jgi:hypothetical protein
MCPPSRRWREPRSAVWLRLRPRRQRSTPRRGLSVLLPSGGGRAALFGRFLDEAAKLYTDALQNRRDDITGLIGIYSLTNRIRLVSSPDVVHAADTVVRIIVDEYLAPNITMKEMRANWIDRHIDPLRDFSEACRQELRIFGRS